MKRILTVILSLILGLGLCACENQNKTEENKENISGEITYEEKKEKKPFWIDSYKFPETANDYNLNFVGFEGVIKKEDLDTKYQIKSVIENVKTEDYVEDGILLSGNSWKSIFNKSNGDGIFFRIENKTDSNMKLTECFESNYWKLSDLSVMPESIGSMLDIEGTNAVPLIEELVQKLGKPTYISKDYESDSVGYAINYSIIYEYESHAFVITIQEIVSSPNGSSDIFTIDNITYYTKELWDLIKENDYYCKDNLLSEGNNRNNVEEQQTNEGENSKLPNNVVKLKDGTVVDGDLIMLIVKEGVEKKEVEEFASQYGGKVVSWQPIISQCDVKFEQTGAEFIVKMQNIFKEQDFVETAALNIYIDAVPQK